MTVMHGVLSQINTCISLYMVNKIANMDIKEGECKKDSNASEYEKIVKACDIW